MGKMLRVKALNTWLLIPIREIWEEALNSRPVSPLISW